MADQHARMAERYKAEMAAAAAEEDALFKNEGSDVGGIISSILDGAGVSEVRNDGVAEGLAIALRTVPVPAYDCRNRSC